MLYSMSRESADTRSKILDATWRLMERCRGQDVSMGNIAKEAGISRQAVYLYFSSRTELMIAMTHYVDEVKGLNERLQHFKQATSGTELLEACVEGWGLYIPEIYGLAKALLLSRETDEATAVAWNDCMGGLRDICGEIIHALDDEGNLASGWSREDATEMFLTMISINNWEQLTVECGWSTSQYITNMKTSLKRIFVSPANLQA